MYVYHIYAFLNFHNNLLVCCHNCDRTCSPLIYIGILFQKASCLFMCYVAAIDVNGVAELAALFVGELNPVAPKAQRKVPVPEG